jgi:hypothetical protein
VEILGIEVSADEALATSWGCQDPNLPHLLDPGDRRYLGFAPRRRYLFGLSVYYFPSMEEDVHARFLKAFFGVPSWTPSKLWPM